MQIKKNKIFKDQISISQGYYAKTDQNIPV